MLGLSINFKQLQEKLKSPNSILCLQEPKFQIKEGIDKLITIDVINDVVFDDPWLIEFELRFSGKIKDLSVLRFGLSLLQHQGVLSFVYRSRQVRNGLLLHTVL